MCHIRNLFPFFKNNKDIIYLDNAATTQKPYVVIDSVVDFYSKYNSNVHRGICFLSEKTTEKFEKSRSNIAKFIKAKDDEIIFTKGTTDSINIIAHSLGNHLNPGDEIVVTIADHHSNIIPWQILSKNKKIKLKFIKLNSFYELDLNHAKEIITYKTKILAFPHISNIFGWISPLKDLIFMAKNVGAFTIIDGAQAPAHIPVDIGNLGCDFYVFSGHKMLGPTGIGVLWGKNKLLKKLPVINGGGDMVESVNIKDFKLADLPHRFEAGTPNIAGVIGLSKAVDFLKENDIYNVLKKQKNIYKKFYNKLILNDDLKLFVNNLDNWIGTISFYHKKIHSYDIAKIASNENICIRVGYHCSQPLIESLKINSIIRISPYVYNSEKEIFKFLDVIEKAKILFEN